MKRFKISEKKHIVIAVVLICSLVFFVGGSITYYAYEVLIKNPTYETTDLSEYGEVNGTNQKSEAEELLGFFPDKIENYFENVTYSFKAEKNWAYSFEAYLEFTISDKEQYDYFRKSAVKWYVGQPFEYDTSYTEYIISDIVRPDFSDEVLESNRVLYYGKQRHFSINNCDVRKMLFNDEEQRVIFVAICVGDECFTSTEFFNTFFDRFDIHPREYAAPRYHYYVERRS